MLLGKLFTATAPILVMGESPRSCPTNLYNTVASDHGQEHSNNEEKQKWDTNRYQNQHAFVYEYGSDLIEVFLNPQPNEWILDLGCGTGELTHRLGGTTKNVIGIDADPQMIATAKKQYPDIQFHQLDGRSFSLDDFFSSDHQDNDDDADGFDAVFSNAALHWIPQQEQVVQCISKVLKPGGRFVAEFGGKGNIQSIANFLDAYCGDATEDNDNDKPKSKNPWYFPSISEYASLLESLGFEVTYAQLFDRPTELSEGWNGLRNWIQMFAGPYLQDMTDDEKELLLKEAEVALEESLWDGKSWIADYRRIRIVASKR